MTLPTFVNGQKLYAEQLQAIVAAIPTSNQQLTNDAGYVTSGSLSGLASLTSPSFLGTPTALTAAVGTNTSQLATCAFVIANAGSGSGVVSGTNPTFTGTITFQNLTTTQPADGSYQLYDNNGTVCIASPGNGSSGGGGGSGSSGVIQSISSGSPGLSITGASATPTITLLAATTSILGGVKVDGTTIVINSGVISAVGSSGSTFNNSTLTGTTTINGSAFNITTLPTDPSTVGANQVWSNGGVLCYGTFSGSGSPSNTPVVITSGSTATIAATQYVTVVNKSDHSAITLTLPASPTAGLRYTVKDLQGLTPITVGSSATIDGSSSITLNSADKPSVDLIYTGSIWFIA